MSSNLYEVLEVSKDATPEQIRKAYKKKALQTHPDRLPPGTSSEEKAASEEAFRKVNNAYEVLKDSEKRRVYDQHGVWPPPEPEAVPPPHRSNHRSHSHHPHHSSRNDFFAGPAYGPHPFFGFTDPFSLFEDVFGHHPRRHRQESSWFASELSRLMHDDFDHAFGPVFGPRHSLSLPSPSFSGTMGRGGWMSESFATTTINGVTETVHKRRDWDGNEHVTRTYADGREIRTINGVEQTHGYNGALHANHEPRYLPHANHEPRYLPPPPTSRPFSSSRPAAHVPISDAPPPYPGHASGEQYVSGNTNHRGHRLHPAMSRSYLPNRNNTHYDMRHWGN